jgi:type I restriction enzyme, S subunit
MEVRSGYKHTEVGVIPENWDVSTVGREFEIKLGKMLDAERNVGVPKPYLGNKAVQWDRIDLSDLPTVPMSPSDIERFRLRKGDLLVCEGGEVGRAALWNAPIEECYYQKALHRLRPTRGFDSRLMVSLLHQWSDRGLLANYVTQTSIAHLPREKFVEVPMPVPPPHEQRAIATVLSDVDALLDTLVRLIAKKRDLKQAAMQQLLTGQTRLPGFHREWKEMQVQDVIANFFCGPSPTCEERNIQDESEWGVLKTTAATKENGWDWTKHKCLPRMFWNKTHLELKKGDVIVTKAGPRHRVGVTAWVNYVPPRIIVSGKMIGLRPRLDEVVPMMLAAAISASETQTYLDQRTTGMAESQVNFENSALLEAPIRLPRIDEQTAIAAVLTDVDWELEALEQRLAKTRDIKRAMMQELLTGKIRLVSREASHA